MMIEPARDNRTLFSSAEAPAEVQEMTDYVGQEDQAPTPQTRPAPAVQTADEGRRPAALITGGPGGLAITSALELAKRGWNILIQYEENAPNASEAEAAIHSAAALAGHETAQAASATADLTDPAAREQLIETMLETFERIDMLVNALPVPPGGEDLLELAEEDFRHVTDRLLTGTFFLTQQAAREMVRLVESGKIDSPRIVTLTSLAAGVSSVDSPAQCIGQAGLSMMNRLLADRLGQHGITSYEIRYGILAGGGEDKSHQQYDRLIAEGLTPLRRWGRPGDVARAVAAVADGLLDFTTGDIIHVDGGFHVQRL